MATAGLGLSWYHRRIGYKPILSAQPATALRALKHQTNRVRLQHKSRLGVVPLRLLGIHRELLRRLRYHGDWLHSFSPRRQETSTLSIVLFVVFNRAIAHDCPLEENRRILAAVRSDVCGVFIATL